MLPEPRKGAARVQLELVKPCRVVSGPKSRPSDLEHVKGTTGLKTWTRRLRLNPLRHPPARSAALEHWAFESLNQPNLRIDSSPLRICELTESRPTRSDLPPAPHASPRGPGCVGRRPAASARRVARHGCPPGPTHGGALDGGGGGAWLAASAVASPACRDAAHLTPGPSRRLGLARHGPRDGLRGRRGDLRNAAGPRVVTT